MRIFVAFFGITRSLRYTAGSVQANLIAPIEAAGHSPCLYGHFHVPETITNARSREFGEAVDPDEHSLLPFSTCLTEPQDPCVVAASFAAARAYPDRFGDNYASARNLCFQLRSLDRLWMLIEPELAEQDWVLFARPDLLYLDRIDTLGLIETLTRTGSELAVPGWHAWGGLNDRFALANARAAKAYATRLRWLEAGIEASDGLHGESLLGFVTLVEGLRVAALPARAVRIRANGQPALQDLLEFGLVQQASAAD